MARCRFTRSATRVALIVIALMSNTVMPRARAAEARTDEVVGGWFGELPCPFTAATPSPSTPTIVPFECVSGSTWDGTWVGHTVYRAEGTFDLATGDLHATVDETLFGVVSTT